MKWLILTPYFIRSGSEQAILNLINELPIEDEISLAIPFRDPILQNYLIRPIKLILLNPVSRFTLNRFLICKLFNRLFNKRVTPEIEFKKILETEEFDRILINTSAIEKKYWNSIIKLRKKSKVIWYVHEMYPYLINESYSTYLNKLNNCNEIWCSSKQVESYISKLVNTKLIVQYPIVRIPNILDNRIRETLIENYGLNGYQIVIMSGSFTLNKDPEVFVDVYNELSLVMDKIAFVWIGIKNIDNAFLNILKSKSINNLMNKLLFIEEMSSGYFEFLSLADVFFLTSRSESLSIVSIESLSLGVPVVSFDNKGINDVVDGSNGIVIEERSIKKASSIIKLILDGDKLFNSSHLKKSVAKFITKIDNL